jgi:hypothetical protein
MHFTCCHICGGLPFLSSLSVLLTGHGASPGLFTCREGVDFDRAFFFEVQQRTRAAEIIRKPQEGISAGKI